MRRGLGLRLRVPRRRDWPYELVGVVSFSLRRKVNSRVVGGADARVGVGGFTFRFVSRVSGGSGAGSACAVTIGSFQ